MLTIRYFSLQTWTVFICALFINIAIAGPVEDGGTLTCSDDTSKANINDVRFPGTGLSGGEKTYLEVYILEQDVDISNWQLCYTYGNNDDCTELGDGNLNEYFYGNSQGDDANPDSFNEGTYLELELPSNATLSPTEGEVLLVNNIDGVNVVIDYLQYCDSNPCGSPRWDVPIKTEVDTAVPTSTILDVNGCGTRVVNHSADNKDLARLPDATGDFGDNGDDVTRGDTNDDSVPSPVFGFTFDESAWNGSANEVIDTEGATSGKAIGNATTSSSSPALPGSPGTCGYGVFDGSGDYVEVGALSLGGGDEDEIELESPSLTFSAWIQTTDNTSTQTIFSFDNDLKLTLTPTGKLTFESDQTNPQILSTADGVIQNDQWYFVSLVIDPSANDILLYTATQAGAITLVASELNFSVPDEFEIEIEDSGDLTIGGGPSLASFNGFIDEPALFGGPLNTEKLAIIKANTRPCAITGPDHYAISHSGTGITCAPTAITFSGHTIGDTLIAPTAGTTITTTINNNTIAKLGTWSLNTGNGTFTALPDGIATYVFDGTETEVILDLLYPLAATINLNVTDGSISESEDPDLTIGRALLEWSTIDTQISGKPSNIGFGSQNTTNLPPNPITIRAIRASDSDPTVCLSAFQNTSVDIDLGAECRNPTNCGGSQISITHNSVPTTISANNDNGVDGTSTYTTFPLLFDNSGIAELMITYPDAGQMQLHSLFNTSNANFAIGTTGSSNDFVVRPFAFRMSVAGNLAEQTVTEGMNIFRDAGENFDVQIEAVTWQQSDDADENGIPDNFTHTSATAFSDLLAGNNITPNFGNETVPATTVLSTTVIAPATGVNGGLSVTSPIFTNGASTTATAWNEVGAMTIDALTTSYLSSGQNITGTSAVIGRFHPAQYEVSVPSITEACVAFTYSRQPFNDSIIVEAQSTSGNTTMNYRDIFATLTLADLSDTDELPFRNDQTPGPDPYDSQAGTFIVDFSTGDLGEAMLDMELTWNMPEQIETTTTVQMATTSTDDGGINIVPGGMPDLNNLGMSVTRFGRLNIGNAFGSELVNLTLPLTTEYFTNNGYIVNPDDNCTVLTDAPNAVLMTTYGHFLLDDVTAYTGNLNAGETTPTLSALNLAAGQSSLNLTAPGIGNDGSVNIEVLLTNAGIPVVHPWLQFDWDGDTNHDNDPTGTATFGIYRGNDSTIYLRELY